MPRTSCGAPMAFGCSRWTTAVDLHRRRASERRVCRLANCKRGDRFAPCSRSPWGLPGCMARPRLRLLALRMDRLPVSVGPLHQPDVLGHPAVLRLRGEPQPRRRRRGSIAREARSSMVATQHRGAAGRSATSSNSNAQWMSKRTATERRSIVGVARRDLNQARRVRQGAMEPARAALHAAMGSVRCLYQGIHYFAHLRRRGT